MFNTSIIDEYIGFFQFDPSLDLIFLRLQSKIPSFSQDFRYDFTVFSKTSCLKLSLFHTEYTLSCKIS